MAGQRMVQYSSLCGMMADCSFTRDAAFLDMPAHLTSITPTKFAPAATQLVADGVPNDGVGDVMTQLLHATSVMAGNSAATMSAVFLVTIADAVMMQPIGGGLGVGGAAVRTICDRIE